MTAGPNPSGQAVPEGQFRPGPAPEPIETPTTPLQVAPESAPAPLQTAAFAAAGDHCPTCGAHMAVDQRYCLECGRRRGDPRLPFMDAVVFMDSVKRPQGAAAAPPPPPRERRPRMSANASLIAGVGTLVLAIGVGVLIGRSGEGGGSTAANTPQVIRVEGGGGGGGGEAESATTEGSKESSSAGDSGKSAKSAKKTAKAKSETGSSGTTKAAEEVLKPAGDVKLPPPETEVGGTCEKGTAGCSENGKFNGNFFGE